MTMHYCDRLSPRGPLRGVWGPRGDLSPTVDDEVVGGEQRWQHAAVGEPPEPETWFVIFVSEAFDDLEAVRPAAVEAISDLDMDRSAQKALRRERPNSKRCLAKSHIRLQAQRVAHRGPGREVV